MKNEPSALIKAVVLGHAVADALGVPVEFCDREALDASPVTDMVGFGTYPFPAGCWSDDTSMSLAALDSLALGRVDLGDIMEKFGAWYYKDAYTPTGELFDVGNTCSFAIENYFEGHLAPTECGLSGDRSNGNGSLMRIHPFVLYAFAKELSLNEKIALIHKASALTHAHETSLLGCGIYAFILSALLKTPDKGAVSQALSAAKAYYADKKDLSAYSRLFEADFSKTDRASIKSGGYVVDTLEAAVYCLLNTNSYRDCVLAAVNLGDDTDTVAAVAGGLAGALYGLASIPKEWLATLKRADYIEALCEKALAAW